MSAKSLGSSGPSGAAQWDLRREEDEEGSFAKEEDDENDVEEGATAVEEGGKVWKAKRTLRK